MHVEEAAGMMAPAGEKHAEFLGFRNMQIVKVLLLVLLPCLIGVGWLVNRNLHAEDETARRETRTRVVKMEMRELFSTFQDAETGQRGFVITGNRRFLEPYDASEAESLTRLAKLHDLTVERLEQQQRLATIKSLAGQKFAELKLVIALREEKGFSAAQEAVMMLSGKKFMDLIRTQVSQFLAVEERLLQQLMAAHHEKVRNTMQSIFLGGLLGALVFLLLFISLRLSLAERREAKTAQRASEDEYRSLFNSIDEGFCIVEMLFDAHKKPIDYRFLDVNPAFERQTGLSTAKGKRMHDLVPGIEDRWVEIYGQVALTGVPHRFVNEAKSMARWFDVYAFRLNGVVRPRVGILFTDVTEQNKSRNEILRLNVELEDRVRQRTAELEAANLELEAFSYSVSHDLRSPLKTIEGFSHLLERSIRDANGTKTTHYLSRIRAGVQQMGALIDGLLYLAQLSRDKLQFGVVDLAEIAKRAAQECRERDPGRQVKITIQDGMPAYGDVRLLSAVIQNLLGNAWKFTARQDLPCIELGSQGGSASETVYFVRDNGAGFDMASVGKIFGTFERLHSAADFSGSGIGLATVKRVIERHGGRIWAEAKENQGATFYFTLRRSVAIGA